MAQESDPGVEKSNGNKRSIRPSSKMDKKKKKRKVSKAGKEKDRIRGILTKGMGGEEFRLSGIELSDDE